MTLSNQNLTFRRQNPMDTITPAKLMEFQELINGIKTRSDELQFLLNALEGAYTYWQLQKLKKQKEKELELLMAEQAEPSGSTSART